MGEFVVTREQIDQVEGLLPFLFSVKGSGKAVARDAAEALMAMLDLTTVADINVPPAADCPTADVLVFRPRGGN